MVMRPFSIGAVSCPVKPLFQKAAPLVPYREKMGKFDRYKSKIDACVSKCPIIQDRKLKRGRFFKAGPQKNRDLAVNSLQKG
jgi:hypothetical protein